MCGVCMYICSREQMADGRWQMADGRRADGQAAVLPEGASTYK